MSFRKPSPSWSFMVISWTPLPKLIIFKIINFPLKSTKEHKNPYQNPPPPKISKLMFHPNGVCIESPTLWYRIKVAPLLLILGYFQKKLNKMWFFYVIPPRFIWSTTPIRYHRLRVWVSVCGLNPIGRDDIFWRENFLFKSHF